MAGTSEWAEITQLVVVAGGTTGVLAVVKFFTDRRKERGKEGADLQKVLAESSAATIATLQRLHKECEERHKECQERVEKVESRIDDLEAALRSVPILRQRDEILRNEIIRTGATMPPLPTVNWSEVELRAKRQPRTGAD